MVGCDLTKAPRVSVIVATKDNLDTIGPCVLSILASTLTDFELIVVNQGNPRALEQALSAYAHDPRLRILHTDTRGLGAARNVGASAALSAYLCYTDGDCTVREDWLADMLACMERYPRAGLVFGRVVAPPYDHAQYMVPVYDPPLGGVEWKETAYLGLMGANMGIRRAAYEAVGGCDEFFGPGAPLAAADDTDLIARVMMAGFTVAADYRPAVVHMFGHRSRAQQPRLWTRDGYAAGALIGKHLRMGNLTFVRHILAHFAAYPYYSLANRLRGRPAIPFAMIAIIYRTLGQGFLRGLRLPLGPGTRYQSAAGSSGPIINDRTP